MAALQLLALNGPLAGDLGPPEAVLTLLDRAALGAAGVDELTAWLLRAVEEEAGAMFERFTSRARRAVVLAQEEARGLGHAHIGTEHLLLGLVREGEGVGAQVLDALGADARSVRQQVLQLLASPAHLGGGLEDRDDDEDLESETIAVVGGLFVENRASAPRSGGCGSCCGATASSRTAASRAPPSAPRRPRPARGG